ncbi:MAG: YhjD/YihY/BrkB family envelope integrity protein, partial [Phycisphaerales bacterium]
YAAVSMLVEIERAFNQIYRVPAGKSWIRRIFQYWTMLTLGTLLLFVSFYVGEQFKAWVERVAEAGGINRDNVVWLMISGYGITVLVSTVLILLVYLAVPNTRVRFVPALAGALVAAILWEAGKWGFTQYVSYSTSYAQLYGSIALIPLFLLWVYVTWFIILLGLNISFHLQQARAGASLALPGGQVIGWEEYDAEPGVVDPTAALALLEVVAGGFRNGTPVSQKRLAQKIGLPQGATRMLLDRLADRGFVHRVADSSGSLAPQGSPETENSLYALARPPELIAAADVLRVGYELSGIQAAQTAASAGGHDGVSPISSTLVERLRRAQLDAAGRSSLASLMNAENAPTDFGPRRSLAGEGGAHGDADVLDAHSIPRSLHPATASRAPTRPAPIPGSDAPPPADVTEPPSKPAPPPADQDSENSRG